MQNFSVLVCETTWGSKGFGSFVKCCADTGSCTREHDIAEGGRIYLGGQQGNAQPVESETIMSNTTSTAAVAAPVTSITKYRALYLVLAAELGWNHTQLATNVDQYSKGTEKVTLHWGSTQLKGYSHSKGKAMVALAEGTEAGKLQRAQSAMGKPMEITKKWAKINPTQAAALEDLATRTFTVITPKAEVEAS
jgi:hypothetical protein